MDKAEKFLELLTNFYESFFVGTADSVEILANIERDYTEEYKMIKSFTDNPNAIEELIEDLPSEKQSILLKLLLRSGKFAKDFANLMNLSEEEKRNLSKDLKSFAKELKKVVKK